MKSGIPKKDEVAFILVDIHSPRYGRPLCFDIDFSGSPSVAVFAAYIFYAYLKHK